MRGSTQQIERISELHKNAMDLAEEAFLARLGGEMERASELTHQAFEKEKEAARLVEPDLDLEPTRSVLHRSAASLAIQCGKTVEAKQLIGVGLSGNPPDEIAQELRELLSQADERSDTGGETKMDPFRDFVVRVLDDLNVDTVTCYGPDPWGSSGQYRLFYMHGVEDGAPMWGPVHPKKMERRLLASPDRMCVIPNTAESDLFRDSTFVRREGVVSLARFHVLTEHPHSRELPGLVLFISYRHPQVFEANYCGRLLTAASAIEAMFRQLGAAPQVDPGALMQQTASLAQIVRDTRNIMGTADAREVIQLVLQSALAITGVGNDGYCSIHLVAPDGTRLRCEYSMSKGKFREASGAEVSLETGDGITTKVARDQRPLFLNDIEVACARWPDRYSYSPPPGEESVPSQSELAVPMYAKGKLIGVLNVEAPNKRAFRPEHVRMIEMLADAAAVAIVGSKFSQQLDQVIESITRIDPTGDLGEVIQTIKSQARAVGADDCDYWRYVDGGFRLPDPSDESQQAELTGKPRSKKDDGEGGISEWLLTKGQDLEPPAKAVLITDMNHQTESCTLQIAIKEGDLLKVKPAPFPQDRRPTLNPGMDEKTLSEVGLPLIFRKKVLGVFWVKWHSTREFAPEEIQLLVRLADQASLAFHFADAHVEPLVRVHAQTLEPIFGERAAYFASNKGSWSAQIFPFVTAMFANIGAISEVLRILETKDAGQELFKRIVKDFHEHAALAVCKHMGAMLGLSAEGIAAIFGAPLKQDEPGDPGTHARHAIAAAFEIAEFFGKGLPQWKHDIQRCAGGKQVPPGFRLRVGLHTDSALVGYLDRDRATRLTAVGPAPAIASRIRDLACKEELLKRNLWPYPPAAEPTALIVCSRAVSGYLLPEDQVAVRDLRRDDADLPGIEGKFDLVVLDRGAKGGQRSEQITPNGSAGKAQKPD